MIVIPNPCAAGSIVCFKPRALRAVTNATMEARSRFCLSAYSGNPSHPLSGWSLTPAGGTNLTV